MKQTLAICDLNAAVAAINEIGVAHSQRCLMAQFGSRITEEKVLHSGMDFVKCKRTMLNVHGMEQLVELFDSHFSSQQLIAEIRRQLPLEVEVFLETIEARIL